MTPVRKASNRQWLVEHHDALVALIALGMLAVHLVLRYLVSTSDFVANIPLWTALVLGGVPVLIELGLNATRGEFGADWLAGISIVTAVLLGQYLAGVLVVLMLSGGEAIEAIDVAAVLNATRVAWSQGQLEDY